MKRTLLISSLLTLFVYCGLGQITIPDNTNISGNWTLSNSPYIIEGRAIINNGQTLTIEPGVEVRLKSSASPSPSWFDYGSGNVGVIRVNGEIIANGTASEPIVFTRDNNGFWGTILIDDSASSNSSFSNCVIEYAKESRNVTGITSTLVFDGGVSIYKSNINFENNELKNNKITGLYIREVNNSFDFNNNILYDNGANGIVIEKSTVNAINNTLYNNSFSSSGFVSAIRCSESNVYLIGNLIYNNDDIGIFTTDSGNVYIVNNTIFSNYQGIRVEDGANTYITNTIVQNNSTNFATGGTIGGAIIEMQYSSTNDNSFPTNVTDGSNNLLSSDALFTNTVNNDFSLQSNSPAINAGNPDTTGLNLPATDILGNLRVDDNIIDMGAIEFQNPINTIDIENLNKLVVYPNPTNNLIKVVYKEDLLISIYTMDGKVMGNYTSKEIDLTKLSSGLYILKIENSKGNVITKRIIKK